MTETDQLQNQTTAAEAEMDEKNRRMIERLFELLPPRREDWSWVDAFLAEAKQMMAEVEELQRKRGGRRPGRPRKSKPEAEQPGVGHP